VQPLLPWESNKYYILWVCVCSFWYPAWNAHALCCHLWPAGLYNILPHYLINGMIFEKKKLLTSKRVFCFPLKLSSETFFILRRTERDMIKKIYAGLHVKYPLFLSDFNETWIFQKLLKYRLLWFYVQREPSCSMRTDRQTDITKLTVVSRNSANAPKETKYADNHPRHEQNPKVLSRCPGAGGDHTLYSALGGWLYCYWST
jgi:hypothetical protein